MNTQPQNYFYSGRISLSLDIFKNTKFKKIFKDAYEGIFYSNPVDNYMKCIDDCSGLLKEVTDEIFVGSGKTYEVLWESNPKLNTDPNYVSKSINLQDWTPNEIVRFFIVDQTDINTQQKSIVTPMLVSVSGIDPMLGTQSEFTGVTH